jgi:hypothetical protein
MKELHKNLNTSPKIINPEDDNDNGNVCKNVGTPSTFDVE